MRPQGLIRVMGMLASITGRVDPAVCVLLCAFAQHLQTPNGGENRVCQGPHRLLLLQHVAHPQKSTALYGLSLHDRKRAGGTRDTTPLTTSLQRLGVAASCMPQLWPVSLLGQTRSAALRLAVKGRGVAALWPRAGTTVRRWAVGVHIVCESGAVAVGVGRLLAALWCGRAAVPGVRQAPPVPGVTHERLGCLLTPWALRPVTPPLTPTLLTAPGGREWHRQASAQLLTPGCVGVRLEQPLQL